MALPYPTISNNSGSLNSGSYFGDEELVLFSRGVVGDLWFGTSEFDSVEVAAYDLTDNLLKWGEFYTEKTFRDVYLTYTNDRNEPVEYVYKELNNDFESYKNAKMLVSPIDQINAFDLSEGGYKFIYNMVRAMVGTKASPLSIKEISPNRKEIKLIPVGDYDNRFVAFALGKFQIKDVSPLLIRDTKQCPYDNIYSQVKDSYTEGLAFLKYIFFLADDAAVVQFLKNTYEDYVRYTYLSSESVNLGYEPTRITRIQGIRTYFQNYLLSSKESVASFSDINNQFYKYVQDAVTRQFEKFQNKTDPRYELAKNFVYEFFTTNFYNPITSFLEQSYTIKYESYFRNALNFGNGRLVPFLNHGYMDERVEQGDPLTILIKLADELPNDLGTKTSCWISNVSMAPLVFSAIYKLFSEIPTIKISPADFTAPIVDVSMTNNNTMYSAEDLQYGTLDQKNQAILNKTATQLNIDYSEFGNFINFSSAVVRLTVLKNKIITLTGLQSSLASMDSTYSSSVLSGGSYPNYLMERDDLTDQIQSMFDSFDGYETYLYNSGDYAYNRSTSQFYDQNFVDSMDLDATNFDKSNPDSLINNTPEHIRLDDENEDYIIFLTMMGHYFDNIYNYILCLPSQRRLTNEVSASFNKKITEELLTLYGWKTDDDSDLASLAEYYTTGSLNKNTDETRMRSIWNRILNNLPLIYKTKGTEECVNLLLSCYGIPSTYLTVKEFGGVDYSDETPVTYTKDEKRWMINASNRVAYFNGNPYASQQPQIQGPWTDNIKTVEFKVSVDLKRDVEYFGGVGQYFYQKGVDVPIFKTLQVAAQNNWSAIWYGTPYNRWFVGSTTGSTTAWYVYASLAGGTSGSQNSGIWASASYSMPGMEIGIKRDVGENMGRAYFRIYGGLYMEHTGSALTGSTTASFHEPYTGSIPAGVGLPVVSHSRSGCYLQTEPFPLFDGSIYNIVLRRNTPYSEFESSSVSALEHHIPTQYDLIAQRNVDGRVAVKASSSIILQWDNNYGFSRPGTWSWGAITNYGFRGMVDRLNLWDVPLSDNDLEDHVNNYDSYAYSGSEAYKHLWWQFYQEYPQTLTDENTLRSGTDWSDPTHDYYLFSEYYDLTNWSDYYSGRMGTRNNVYASTNYTASTTSHSISTASLAYFTTYWKSHMNPWATNDQNISYYAPYASGFVDQPWTNSVYNLHGTCTYETKSCFPYSSVEFTVPITRTSPKYGPNKLKNEKIKKKSQTLEARLDPLAASTIFGNPSVSPDSNQVGFFADPQKWRNSDIGNYFGNINLIEELAEPASLMTDKYESLALKRRQYNDSAPNYTFFNEMNTLYRMYFDNSLFSVIKRMLPARSNALTGFLVEPSILERPKYRYHPISSSVTQFGEFAQFSASISNIAVITQSLLWGDPNEPSESLGTKLKSSYPPNYYAEIDLSHEANPNRTLPTNFGGNSIGGRDKIQFSQYGITDPLDRVGVVYEMDLDRDTKSSGSVYFLLKRWQKQRIYTRTLSASAEKPERPDMGAYSTSSTYLYDLIAVTPSFMNSVAFTASALDYDVNGNAIPDVVGPPAQYMHSINTFKSTPNEGISNIRAIDIDWFYPDIFTRAMDESSETYFEIVNGYPRNHYTHKAMTFSKQTFPNVVSAGFSGSLFVKGRQTVSTTIGTDGLTDGSYPIETIDVGNVNIIKSDSVLNV